MLILGQAWAEEFNKNSDAKVSVSGEGSGVGISALIGGTTDIAETSREMSADELQKAKAKGVNPVQTLVARDGLAVIVNPDNPVRKLTMDQLRDIFMGNVKNWKEVGGKDQKILLVSRDTNSGTHVYFKEHVLRRGNSKGTEEFPNTALMVVSSQSAVQTVTQDKGAVAYVGLGYTGPKVGTVAVAKTPAGPYVTPSMETVMNNTYPISRPLFFYTNGEPKGVAKKYLDFVLSDKGQGIVEKLDFVPLRKI
jgi:phosphate transport system substrate-binding protein